MKVSIKVLKIYYKTVCTARTARHCKHLSRSYRYGKHISHETNEMHLQTVRHGALPWYSTETTFLRLSEVGGMVSEEASIGENRVARRRLFSTF